MSNTDGFQGSGEISYLEEPKKETPKKWKQPHKSDARKAKSSGSYPDYFSWKTRSGHVLQLDDSKGGETVTLQHRGGTAIQMAPDGSMHVTAHNGKYEITFGENRVTISGAQDITVKGDASFRVYGDYNVTCQKDYNLTVLGNFNITAKNLNRQVLGNIDTQARNENKKLMGSSAKIARGAIAYVSKGSATIASQSDQIFLGGGAGANIWAKKGNITQNIAEQGDFHQETKDGSMNMITDGNDGHIRVQSKQGKMEFKSKQDMNQKVEQGNFKVTADQGDIGHEATAGNIQTRAISGGIKQQAQQFSGNYTQSADVTAGTDLDLRGGGKASLHAPTTHVSGTTVHVNGATATNIDGTSALNLNGGMSTVMSALGIQIPFDFGSFTDPQSSEGTSRGVHAPDRPAGRDEADGWL